MSDYGSVIDHLLQTVDVNAHLQPFMGLSGWKQVEPDNNWWIWHGPKDTNGEPSELVFPINAKMAERRSYNIKALELLAFLSNEPMERLLQRVLNFDRDLLFLRNVDTNLENVLSFDRVVGQLTNFKQVLLHAYRAERDPRPYVAQASEVDRSRVRGYSFGHTMPGSFIFSVSTPRLSVDQEPRAQTSYIEGNDQPVRRPIQRRVSERIARGLLATETTTADELVDTYYRGFNANMCQSMAEVASNGEHTVEIQIAWSPRIRVSPDLADFKPVEVDRTTCETFIYVAEKLKKAAPDVALFRGFISGLNVNDNPLLEGSLRKVYLKAANPETGRSAQFALLLGREDYAKALDSHARWVAIQVTGYPAKAPDGWHIDHPVDFRLLE